MKRLFLVLLLSLTGCVSLRHRPVDDKINILGNPLLTCIDLETDKSVTGKYVCKKTLEPDVIPPCQAFFLNEVDKIVIENGGVYYTGYNCTFAYEYPDEH